VHCYTKSLAARLLFSGQASQSHSNRHLKIPMMLDGSKNRENLQWRGVGSKSKAKGREENWTQMPPSQNTKVSQCCTHGALSLPPSTPKRCRRATRRFCNAHGAVSRVP
jgi:hypothetical protein